MTNPLSPASPLALDGKKYIPFTLAWKTILFFFFIHPVSPAVIASLQKENVCVGGGGERGEINTNVSTGREFTFLMVCKHCSFKSCCIKPWIPSITELQNGNKKRGKKYLFLPPSQPFRRFPSRTGSESPSPTPSQLRPAACAGEPGTDLGP